MRTRLLALTALLGAVALAGCGSDSSGTTSTRAAVTTATTTTATSATTGTGGGDRTSASAAQLVAEMKTALTAVKSYHVDGTGKDKDDGKLALSADIKAPGSANLTIALGDRRAQMIIIGDATYIKASKAFWSGVGGSDPRVMKLLVDRWIKAPSGATDSQSLLAQMLPAGLARCTAKDLSGITNGGAVTVDGQPAVALKGAGTRPGTSPGELDLAATGPALPLRVQQLGPDKPGGKPDKSCGDDPSEPDTTLSSDFRFSRFDEPVTIEAPANALDLSQAMSGSGGKA
jgi:hypothetical protein